MSSTTSTIPKNNQIQALASIMLINSKSSYDKNPSSAHLQQSSRMTKNLKLVFSGAAQSPRTAIKILLFIMVCFNPKSLPFSFS